MRTQDFRLAGPKDRDTLVALIEAYYAYDGHQVSRERIEKTVDVIVNGTPNAKAWLMSEGVKPVGYMVLTFGFSLEAGGPDAILDELYLRPDWRGKGYGRAALIFAEEMALKEGAVTLSLFVERRNAKAKRFYEAAGYRERTWDLMEKRLEGL